MTKNPLLEPQNHQTDFLEITPIAKKTVTLSLVIPTFNESQNIRTMIERVTKVLDAVLPESYELIVVDDDSPDGTWEKAERLADRHPKLRVIRRTDEKGLSTAVIRGWQQANGALLGVIDADLQHPPEVLEKLVAAMKDQETDMAVASRHTKDGGVSDWSFYRRIISRVAHVIALIILPRSAGKVSDPMSGYFLVRRSAIEGSPLSPIGYKILLEVLFRGRIKNVKEVGYIFQERERGGSKANARIYFEFLIHLMKMRFPNKKKSQ